MESIEQIIESELVQFAQLKSGRYCTIFKTPGDKKSSFSVLLEDIEPWWLKKYVYSILANEVGSIQLEKILPKEQHSIFQKWRALKKFHKRTTSGSLKDKKEKLRQYLLLLKEKGEKNKIPAEEYEYCGDDSETPQTQPQSLDDDDEQMNEEEEEKGKKKNYDYDYSDYDDD